MLPEDLGPVPGPGPLRHAVLGLASRSRAPAAFGHAGRHQVLENAELTLDTGHLACVGEGHACGLCLHVLQSRW